MIDLTINPEGPFKVHMLNEEGKLKAQCLASAFNTLLDLVISRTRPDPSKARSSMSDPAAHGWPPANNEEMRQFVFKLQEASFYAKRAMAMLPENQQ
jgi:hypothetical protein